MVYNIVYNFANNGFDGLVCRTGSRKWLRTRLRI